MSASPTAAPTPAAGYEWTEVSKKTGSCPERFRQARVVPVSPWCLSHTRRVLDVVSATTLLLMVLPVMLVVGMTIKLTSRGPMLFRQRRLGKDGKEFWLLKFRSMTNDNGHVESPITRDGDPRITRFGRIIRKLKIDELPQLLNVIRGDMGLAGPRPYIPDFFRYLPSEYRQILAVRPGLTGLATFMFRNEEELLSKLPPTQLQQVYFTSVLPKKLDLDLEYAARATFVSDAALTIRTAAALIIPWSQKSNIFTAEDQESLPQQSLEKAA